MERTDQASNTEDVYQFLTVLRDICNNIYDLVDVMRDIRTDVRAIRDPKEPASHD